MTKICNDSRHRSKDQPIVQHGDGAAAAVGNSAARWERRSPSVQSVSTYSNGSECCCYWRCRAVLCTVCCNCSKDTQSHCCCCPLVPRRRRLRACAASCGSVCVQSAVNGPVGRRILHRNHLTKKNISEPQPALVIKAPLFKSALESQIVDHSNSLCLVSRRVLTEKKHNEVKESVFIIVVNIFLFSDLLIIVVCPPPTVTNPGFRTMYYYSTQVNKYVCI